MWTEMDVAETSATVPGCRFAPTLRAVRCGRPAKNVCDRVMRKNLKKPLKTRLSASSREMGYNEPRMMPMPLLQEPITKEQFEQELRTLPPREAD